MGRFSVDKLEIISDHLSTRFFIRDNLDGLCYDVRHKVSDGYEVQYDTWAENICFLLNAQEDKLNAILSKLDLVEQNIMDLKGKYSDEPKGEVLDELIGNIRGLD